VSNCVWHVDHNNGAEVGSCVTQNTKISVLTLNSLTRILVFIKIYIYLKIFKVFKYALYTKTFQLQVLL
jgi:hypothetical protein